MSKQFLVLLVTLCTLTASAQVKIGDNVSTINPNSLLELESSTKGLLAPRVALTSTTSPAPLTAPVPSGMIVYSSGGTVTNGFYFWNGAEWLAVQSAANTRKSYVLVKSAADFPAPVDGVITLTAGTTYEVNGTILVSSKINLNGCYLVGMDANNDKLVYTASSGELFTGNKGGTIKTVTMVAPNTGSRLFGFDMPVTENLIVRDAIIANCKNVGLVKGGNIVFFSVINYSNNLQGITYENCLHLLLDNTGWFGTNTGIYEKFVGTFQIIEKLGGFSQTTVGGTALDITGITSIAVGADLKNSAFLGTGTKVNGTFTGNWEVESAGLMSEKDATASGTIYVTTPGATDITAINSPRKVGGTTVASELIRFTSPANNRLQYNGTKTRTFIVNATLSATGASGTYIYAFYIYKNGVVIPGSKQRTKVLSSIGDIQTVAIVCTVTLNPGDYIEVWAENTEANVDLTVQNMTLSIK